MESKAHDFREGDSLLIKKEYEDALLSYLRPYKKGGSYHLDPKSSSSREVFPRLAALFEEMAINGYTLNPLQKKIVQHLFEYAEINFTNTMQICSQKIVLEEIENIFSKILNIDCVEQGYFEDEIIITNLQKNKKVLINLNQPSQTSKIFSEKVIYDNEFQDFLSSPQVLMTLKKVLIFNHFIENFFTSIRSLILKECRFNLNIINKEEKIIKFLESLSSNCFRNEYCWIQTDEETTYVEDIYKRNLKKINNNEILLNIEILILGSYKSLNHYKRLKEKLTNASDDGIFSEIIKKQITDLNIEKKLQQSIKKITPIKNEVSIKVRKQYEDNPFPRWDYLKRSLSINYIDIVKARTSSKFQKIEVKKILVAGCGTGKHAINIALYDSEIAIHAIDLSLASLAYAKRKSQEMNIKNIQWFQSDILKLMDHEESYDLIESVGVLHHLEKPKQGFDILSNKLNNGGLMRLGLYSRTYRNLLKPKKEFIKKHNLGKNIQQIREARRLLMESLDPQLLMNVSDCYALSSFIDLLMHEQECDFDIDNLKDLYELEYNFLGFHFNTNSKQHENEQLYRKNFPKDLNMDNIDNWKKIEEKNKTLFSSMYQFWLQKKS